MLSRTEFDTIVDVYGQVLLNYAFAVCGDAELAQDLVQTVLARVLQRQADWSSVRDPGAYLRRAVVNELTSHLRRQQVFWRLAPKIVDGRTAPDPADGITAMAAIRDALDCLPLRQRQALVLRYLDDLPDEAIASALGCTQATVRSLVNRGLRNVRATLEESS